MLRLSGDPTPESREDLRCGGRRNLRSATAVLPDREMSPPQAGQQFDGELLAGGQVLDRNSETGVLVCHRGAAENRSSELCNPLHDEALQKQPIH